MTANKTISKYKTIIVLVSLLAIVITLLALWTIKLGAYRSNEAPRSHDRGIFSSLLRREQNPSEAENSSHSSGRRQRLWPTKSTGLHLWFSAKEDKPYVSQIEKLENQSVLDDLREIESDANTGESQNTKVQPQNTENELYQGF